MTRDAGSRQLLALSGARHPHIGSGIEVARGGLSIPRYRDHRASQRDEGDDANRQRQEKNA